MMPYLSRLEDAAAKRRAYLRNKQAYIDRSRKQKDKTREAARQVVREHLAANPCADCGESDPVVLEFDHIDPEKKQFNVSNAVRSGCVSLDRIKRDILNCVVRCANCHRRRTAQQFGWFSKEL